MLDQTIRRDHTSLNNASDYRANGLPDYQATTLSD